MVSFRLKRFAENPLLMPSMERFWESAAVFNPSVIKRNENYIMLYRAMAKIQRTPGDIVNISSIGMAKSKDGIKFIQRKFFFGPEYTYEAYACEDPRITELEGKYYIFYTAVSGFPPKPENVKLALAVTEDFEDYEKFGLVCPFNSKAGSLFPRRIRGKMCMMFTLNPDSPPSKLGIVYFNRIDDLKDEEFWRKWSETLEPGKNVIDLRGTSPFVEVGSSPIETREGWLVFVPDIVYEGGRFVEFRITAILLDKDNPARVICRAKEPILYPDVGYEQMRGFDPKRIAMPTGAIVKGNDVFVYYGASDLFCCGARCELSELLKYLADECKL